MRKIIFLFIALIVISVIGCAVLRDPIIRKTQPIDNFQYVIIPKMSDKYSSKQSLYGNQYGVYGESSSKVINPGEMIEGILLKKGITRLTKIQPNLLSKTLIVKYGESGKRDIAGGLGGFTLEVTIVLVSAKTNENIYFCTAEGQGSTEADDIREAIIRCLSGI